MNETVSLIPLPERCYINLSHPASSKVSWRSLGIVLGRVAALPNLTDIFLSQAQFNLLAARFTPRPLRPLMMTSGLQVILTNLAYVETDCDSGQTTLQRPSGGLCELAKHLGSSYPAPTPSRALTAPSWSKSGKPPQSPPSTNSPAEA
ncbi:hypothetical protein [Pseudovibrio denitrificans]|uniref:hypothetical protein n=1 Tax=Pseudovibrio denitrificans TaxID=258256 RepID=UPI0006D16CCC|nr:hypothetical protein [Pseudovibrio denitrificans]